MTKNLVAEFSCSLNSNGTFKKYQIVSGSTFSQEFSETLDSADIILSHVPSADRLINLHQYDCVRVYNDNNELDFDHVYLLDTFQEKEERIGSEIIYGYILKLFSQTKLLEKWQCPNISITHKVDENGHITKLSIAQHICRLMELYVPKVKMYNSTTNLWEYRHIIEIPGTKDGNYLSRNFNVQQNLVYGTPLTLTFNYPALIGKTPKPNTAWGSCINISPAGFASVTINNIDYDTGDITATFTNLNALLHTTITSFTFSFHISTYETYSFANNLQFYNKFKQTSADLPFNTPTLRQTITTLMQQVGCIPTVTNFRLGYLDFNTTISNFGGNDQWVNNTVNYIERSASSDSYANTLVSMAGSVLDSGNQVISESLGFRDSSNVLLRQKSNLVLETKFPIYKVEKFTLNNMYTYSLGYGTTIIAYPSSGPASTAHRFVFTGTKKMEYRTVVNSYSGWQPTDKIYLTIKGYKWIGTSHTQWQLVETFTTTKTGDNEIRATQSFDYSSRDDIDFFTLKMVAECEDYSDYSFTHNASYLIATDMTGYVKSDITPLIKENSVREQLKVDVTDLPSPSSPSSTLEELSEYLYGTVGYAIGGNTISGFSSTYRRVYASIFGSIRKEYTYIENIYNFLAEPLRIEESLLKTLGYGELLDVKCVENLEEVEVYNFSHLTFDIIYQPLNSFNLSYVKQKEDIQIPIEQLNNSASGITDFDRLSISEQEQVNRIGNPTVFISQTTENFSDLQGGTSNFVPTKLGDEIIFKRTFSINNYHYNVNYVGSKDSILKNYFTSIRTKYRAYQYVDYNQTTLRKEKDVIYALISLNGKYDADDKISIDNNNLKKFITGCSIIDYSKLKYYVETSEGVSCKNDISLITNENMFAIITENYSPDSAGPYLKSLDPIWETAEEEHEQIGGIPQTYHHWDNYYYDSHAISYENDINIANSQTNIIHLPIVTGLTRDTAFTLCDNKNASVLTKTVYQDISEKINRTLQFIYYTDSPDRIAWTEHFIANNGFVRNSDAVPNAIYFTNSLSLDKDSHSVPTGDVLWNGSFDSLLNVYSTNAGTYIQISWTGNYHYLKVVKKDGNNVQDIIVFKRNNYEVLTKFYISLNDTKTNKVFDISNGGILYNRFVINTGGTRNVTPIYNEVSE